MTGTELPAGLHVLVTRPEHQAESLCRLIEEAGAVPIRFPTLAIESLTGSDGVRQAAARMLQKDLLVFTSPNAVHHGMEALAAAGLTWPGEGAPQVAAIGRATADSLAARGVRVAVAPEGPYTSEGLLAHPRLHRVSGLRTMLVKGVGGREVLADTLRERGAMVESLAVYRRALPRTHALDLAEALLEGNVHVAVVTSVEALENLLTLAGEEGRAALLSVGLVTVSGRVATAARFRGFHGGIAVAPEASDSGVLEGIRRWCKAEQEARSSMTDNKREPGEERESERHDTGSGASPADAGDPRPEDSTAAGEGDQAAGGSGNSLPAKVDGAEDADESPGERSGEDGGDGGDGDEPPADDGDKEHSGDRRSTVAIVLVVLLLVLGLGGGWWLYDRQEALRAGLEARAPASDLAAIREDVDSQAERLAARVDNLAAEHQAHVQHLANAEEAVAQLRETQSRAREQLERIEELAGAQRSDWIQSEADYLYRVARSRVQYHQDVEGALAALRNADSLLRELGGEGADRRRDMQAAIDALVEAPRVDRSGISRELHALIAAVDDWPLAETTTRLEPQPVEGQPDADLRTVEGWQRAAERAWEQVKTSLSSLVVVRREDAPPPLLSPDEEWFLREHVRIQLLTARLALLERDEASYRSSLEQAERWMQRHFRAEGAAADDLERVRELRERTVAPSLPDLDRLADGADEGD